MWAWLGWLRDGLLHRVGVRRGLEAAEGGVEFAGVDHEGARNWQTVSLNSRSSGENTPVAASSAGLATLAWTGTGRPGARGLYRRTAAR